LDFELNVVGRVNPHFGEPVLARLKALRRNDRTRLHYYDAASDVVLAQLYATARATVFPTIAEGCGLPVLESLWMGVPCVCSDLPVLRENADGGGCLPVALNDPVAWHTALRGVLREEKLYARLATEATSRPLPTWANAAQILKRALQA
jgi:glycosyltransferase involved in cell wall biosynthesis